jgi:hypothetical protein
MDSCCNAVANSAVDRFGVGRVSGSDHRIRFPPRLEVVVLEENPCCFAPQPGHDPTFQRLPYNESRTPADTPGRRLTASHGNDALLHRQPKN